MSESYDAIVIGSGTAGQTAAYDLREHGWRVAVVEHSERPGGTCALRGCQAKKWFYEGTEIVAKSRHLAGKGIEVPAVASWRSLRDAKNQFTQAVPDNTVAGFDGAGIDLIAGRARFKDERTLIVDGKSLSAAFFIVATGARPMPLPIDGQGNMITSDDFMELRQLPARIVFIGGGFISFEFAHFAARLGPSGVHCTILEAGPHPLGPFDRQMVDLLVDASARENIDVHCNVAVESIEKNGSAFRVHTEDGRRFDCDMVVHGAGRSADIEDLDLDNAGIRHAEKGITVTNDMRTSNPRIFAAGDCVGSTQLARVADAEAHVAAANMLHARGAGEEKCMDYAVVPAGLFTYPQYGMVGATEAALKEKGITYTRSQDQALSWPTYRRVGMRSAAYKLLAAEDGQLLGAHILSDNATGMISRFAMAMSNRISVDVLYRQSILTPYPSRESDTIYMLEPLISSSA
jgi:glutathione reductase (NADPH)